MKNINNFDCFINEKNVNMVEIDNLVKLYEFNTMSDEEYYGNDDLNNMSDVKIGGEAEKALTFNKSDFVKFLIKILPYFKNLEDRDNKVKLLKKLDNYLYPFFLVSGVLSAAYFKEPQVKEFIDNLFTQTGASVMYIVSNLAAFVYKLSALYMTDKGNTIDISIVIDKTKDGYVVDFPFYGSVNVKNKYRIIYNAFIRRIKEFDGVDGMVVKFGKEAYLKGGKPSEFSQHIVTLNFYPKELIDLLHETAYSFYEERVKDADIHNIPYKIDRVGTIKEYPENRYVIYSCKNWKNSNGDIRYVQTSHNIELYIQRVPYKQINELANKIEKLEFKFHDIEY